jgi:hypothetical protein
MQSKPSYLPTVASLWIGGSLSYLEQVCLKSFVDFGHRTILYTYDNVTGVPDGVEVIDANTVFPLEQYITHRKSGSPALHSDVFRYYLIANHDVIWIDADVLCMRSWEFDTQRVYGWEKKPRLVCGAVLGFPRDSEALNQLLEFCRDEYPVPPWLSSDDQARLHKLHDAGTPEHVTDLPWGVWGPTALTYFLKKTGEIENTMEQVAFYPISFKDRRKLLKRQVDLSGEINDDCYGVHLWNRRLRRRLVTHHDGFPHHKSFLGQALKVHGIDPRRAMIPDEPPPGFLTREEMRRKQLQEVGSSELSTKHAEEIDEMLQGPDENL